MPVTETGHEIREFRLRAAEVNEEGTFAGYASTFGNVDSYGDVIAPGAFRKTLADQPIRPLLWCHEPREVIGTAELTEDSKGLRLRGKLELDVTRAREVHSLMRAGAVRGLSIGFFPRQSEARGEGRVIREIELVEVSLTPFPANPRAKVENVRSKPAAGAEKREELSDMELKEIEAKFNKFGETLAEIGEKFTAMQRQVDQIDLKMQDRWPTAFGAGAGDFARELVTKFNEHREGFDRYGKVRFEVRTITSAGITTPQPSSEIGLAAAPAYGAVRRLFRTVAADAASIFQIREDSASGWVASPQVETNAKNEATVSLSAKTLPIQTIAVWVAAAKQALDDVNGLENFIRSRLLWALEAEIEEQLLLGSGVSPNLDGLVIQAASFNTALLGTSWNYADVIGAAAVQVRTAGFSPNFIVLNPNDAFRLRHQKDTTGQYISLPSMPPIIESSAMTEGQFLAGDAAQAVVRVRQGAAVEISTEHSDYFVKNMVAIRAEERLALQVISPAAFVKGAFTVSPA